MSTTFRTLTLAAVCVCSLFGAATVASAASPGRVIGLSAQIEGQTRALAADLRARYRNTSVFPQLMSEVASLVNGSDHINAVARTSRDYDHMAADLRDLDQCVSHLAMLLNRVEYDPRVLGNTRPTRNMLGRIDSLVAELRAEVRHLDWHDGHDHGFGGGRPGFGPGYGPGTGGGIGLGVNPGGGFFIGGRNWGIQFGR